MSTGCIATYFAEEAGKTRLTDEIEFALPGGPLAELLGGWLVTAQLDQLFRYRHKVTQRECDRTSQAEA